MVNSGYALSATGAGATIPVDWKTTSFVLGVQIVVSGTNTSKLQYTMDNPMDASVTPTWVDAAAPLASVTTTTATSFSIPCRAVRLNMTARTNGTATITVIQGTENG